tara:strand:- start:187 stop:537 length:351 start_codon:yes stop_codon:yes gene_type:complete
MSDKNGSVNKNDGFELKTTKEAVLFMSGGCSEWWDYILRWDDDLKLSVFIHDRDGLHEQKCQLIYDSETKNIEEVAVDADLKELSLSKILIGIDFFNQEEEVEPEPEPEAETEVSS